MSVARPQPRELRTWPRVDLVLPLPPSVNGLLVFSTGVRGRTKSQPYRAWLDEAGWRINEARASGLPSRLGPGPYVSRVRWPIDDAADADNRLKALHDLLAQHGVTPDDRHLRGGSYWRSAAVGPGTCQVRVWSFPGQSSGR